MSIANKIQHLVADAGELPAPLDFRRLLLVVSQVFGVQAELLTMRDKSQPVALARQVAMTIAYETGLSSNAVGKLFRRDHGTVLHAKKVVYDIAKGSRHRERAQIKAAVIRYNAGTQ